MVGSRFKLRATLLFLILLQLTATAFSQTLAPGAPGKDAQWATAGKQGVGTSATLESKVWFTLAQGALTEVYYPDVTVANVHLLQFVVVNPKTKKVETEQDDAFHQIEVTKSDSLTFQQINKAKNGEWEIRKLYVTDPLRNTVLISTYFLTKNKDLKLYLYFDSSIDNSGMKDTGWTEDGILYATDKKNAVALIADSGFGKNVTNGFLGTSDGILQLKNTGKISNYQRAENGNVVQFAEVKTKLEFEGKEGRWIDSQYFALGFGKTTGEARSAAQGSLKEGYVDVWKKYEKGWADYIKTIRKVEPKYQAQFNMAAMQLKAHEDKTVRGANIASLSVPWGGGENANEANIGGYHLIWSRDLYQVATAFIALGDKDAAIRALNFLFKVQQKPDGSFPQNSYLDGKPFWGSLQLDEVAYPLILAHELGLNDKETYEKHVKKAADFIVKNGPSTPQERWEEEAGYSPSTIAAEIAGLVCAAEIAKKNGDNSAAELYLKTADDWAANVEKWTATTTGKYGDGNYYLRITQNGKPDAGEKIELNNGAGFFDEREIIDAGFLELVRLGIKPADDPLIAKSLKVVDEVIRVRTPNGDGFYRYNNDGYGEMDDGRRWNWDGKYTGKGRLWALLSGERGQYELALHALGREKNGDKPLPRGYTKWELVKKDAERRLNSMLGFANDGLMIPEQIWDKAETPKNIDKQFVPELKFGEGTGSATPLAWSMAQFIRLAVNLQEGRNLDTPQVVYDRYVLGKKESAQNSSVEKIVEGLENSCFWKWSNTNSSDLSGTLEFIKKSKNPHLISCKPDKYSAIFFYKDKAEDVEIVGDFTDWKPKGLKLKQFTTSNIDKDLKFISLENLFAPTSRVEYKLVVDGKWITDPANPNKVENGVGGENSFFTMPDYQQTVWDKEPSFKLEGYDEPFIIEPKVKNLEIQTKNFGTKKIKVYLPFGYEKSKESFPVLYVQDGSDYLNKAKAAIQMENLVIAKKIKPFIIVFLDPQDRMKEYWASDDYARFVATEVVPAIDAKYKTIKSRDGRGIIGASLGGITSIWVGLKYPEVFSMIGGQSSSFWVDNERVVKELAKLDAAKTKFRFYLDDGTLEGAEDTRRVAVMLRAKGFPVTYLEGETGHNWTAWRDRLSEAFVAFVN